MDCSPSLSLSHEIHLFICNPLCGKIEQIFPIQHVLAIYYHYYTMDDCLGHLQSKLTMCVLS